MLYQNRITGGLARSSLSMEKASLCLDANEEVIYIDRMILLRTMQP